MRVSYAALVANYPKKSVLAGAQLYESIGHPELSQNMYWQNTCAVRLSLALIAAGMSVPGHMKILAGRFKGRQFQPGQFKLSKYLARPTVLGKPEKFEGGYAASKAIGCRKGIISVFKLYGPTDTQGHIDIVGPSADGQPLCAMSCYWGAVEVWFWPLR